MYLVKGGALVIGFSALGLVMSYAAIHYPGVFATVLGLVGSYFLGFMLFSNKSEDL